MLLWGRKLNLFDLSPQVPWLTLIWASLVVPALLIMLAPSEQKQLIRWVATIGALLSLLLSVLVWLAYDPSDVQGQYGTFQFVERLNWVPVLGISYFLGVDGISIPMLILTGVVIFTGCIISFNIEQRVKEFYVLLLLLVVGVYGVFLSLDLFLLFVFYELAVLPMYILIAVWGSTRKEYGAMKLTLYLMAGSAFILVGMLAVYFGSGLQTFDMLTLARAAGYGREFQVAFFLPMFLGFAVLAGMFPFHTWSPVGHVAAPTAVSMLHAGVLMKLGAYGCLRVAMWLMPQGAQAWLWLIAILTLVNAVYGATIAMAQRDAKFIIGYSSVSHMGLTVMGLAAGNQIGIIGAVLQMFAHGIMTALFFAVVGRMVYDRTHTRQLPELGGLYRVMPFAALMFIVGGLSSMGMPLLAGFWAEFNIFMGVWEAYPWVAILAALAIPITGAYVLRATYAIFFGELKNPEFWHLPKLTWPEYTTGLIMAVILLVVGLFPGALTDLIDSGVGPIVAQLENVAPPIVQAGE
jgi:NADH-quinone oxidoreductase subunit M